LLLTDYTSVMNWFHLTFYVPSVGFLLIFGPHLYINRSQLCMAPRLL
jgi:hypothetical protein